MSSNHARLTRAASLWFIEDASSTNGVVVNGGSIRRAPLRHGDLIETGRTFWVYLEEAGTDGVLSEPMELGTWTTWSPRLARALTLLRSEAKTAHSILLFGPPGTGKGHLARSLHVSSNRSGRLVHLDCRERRPARLLVDLFGGSGEGSRLRDAQGGTLFLENIEVLPRDAQTRLAEALSTSASDPSAARVVASSLLDPARAVKERVLRRAFVDAFVCIGLPSLDERRQDLGLLIDAFLARARGADSISRDACRALLRAHWKMHVRGLARVIEAAAVLGTPTDGEVGRGRIETVHLPGEILNQYSAPHHPTILADVIDANDPNEEDEGERTEATAVVGSAARRADEPTSHAPGGTGVDVDATDPRLDAQAAPPIVDEPEQGKAPSAFHDFSGLERSYAQAVDPDLIVDALQRARGNVSAAARFLGKPRAVVQRWIAEFQLEPDEYR